jgi:hypothetical protein
MNRRSAGQIAAASKSALATPLRECASQNSVICMRDAFTRKCGFQMNRLIFG